MTWTVTGTPTASYAIRFKVGDQVNTTSPVFGGGNGSDSWLVNFLQIGQSAISNVNTSPTLGPVSTSVILRTSPIP